jgi:hypothetical protein
MALFIARNEASGRRLLMQYHFFFVPAPDQFEKQFEKQFAVGDMPIIPACLRQDRVRRSSDLSHGS